MKHLIRKCPKCKSYTLKFSCEKCKVPTIDAHPARYSPDDKYALYRISDRYIQAVEVDQENSRK
ncbi:MAG TPA: RNA-protein complex protein Nop10 [Candidatus Bathyarchaeia archaeon]|nr:RNA-protein complex protein Nop10 [Candidatus Bathyarchaeia archaeon]